LPCWVEGVKSCDDWITSLIVKTGTPEAPTTSLVTHELAGYGVSKKRNSMS
jgi:hypothetical protein